MEKNNSHHSGMNMRTGKSGREIPALYRLLFLLTGIAATLWFLIRVIPKPSRATYPCMRAAAPLASGFVIWLTGVAGGYLGFSRFKGLIKKRRYVLAILAVTISTVAFGLAFLSVNRDSMAFSRTELTSAYEPNKPVGTPKGIYPGRVVWVWDQDATNENMTNTEGDYWFQNTDQIVVDSMLSRGIRNLAGEGTVGQSWDALFHYFNSAHQRGDAGYINGEKIFIKLNLTTSCCGGMGGNSTAKTVWLDHMDVTPQLVLSLLRQLVYDCSVPQADITVGDPFRRFHDVYWDICATEFPDVNYVDDLGINGRKKTVLSAGDELHFSDGNYSTRIPQDYIDASYFINLPCLKSHNAGGVTLCAKNHQGSIIQPEETDVSAQSASYMHYSLPATLTGHKQYRHLVDYTGHKYLGGNTILNIVDGIWAGVDWSGVITKWKMSPFDNDYPNSLFLSQDPVAIDAVCFDFILKEYESRAEKWPFFNGTDDYMLQSADPSEWPTGFVYDPEDDGTPLQSLGVYEHWNNPEKKQYSVNLGKDYGIHLVSVPADLVETIPQNVEDMKSPGNHFYVYPNPAIDIVRLACSFRETGHVAVEMYDMNGKEFRQLNMKNVQAGDYEYTLDVKDMKAGIYLVRMTHQSTTRTISRTLKLKVR